MNMTSLFRRSLRSTAIIAGLALALGAASAQAASDAAAPKAHSDGLGAAVADTAITAKVKAKLMGDEGLKNSRIKVTTTNGVVTLEGTASSSKAKSAAEAATKSVEGVKSVDNNLKTPATSKASAKTRDAVDKTERVASDSWITTKVKSGILASSVSRGFNVSVKTTHGVVALGGTLPNRDAVDHVKDIASKVDGVKSVDTSALKVAGN